MAVLVTVPIVINIAFLFEFSISDPLTILKKASDTIFFSSGYIDSVSFVFKG